MIMKRSFLFVLLVMLFLGGLLFAHGQQELTENIEDLSVNNKGLSYGVLENTNEFITLIDSYDNEVRLKKTIKKIVVHDMGSALASIRALDAQDLIIACNSYVKKNTTFFPEFSKLPIISEESQAVDSELILQLQPDFILSRPFYYQQLGDVIISEIPVVQLSFNSIESYKKLGAILDKDVEATEFINWIKSYTDIIDSRISKLDKEEYKSVFAYYGGEYGMSDPPPYGTFGKDNALRNELINRAGGISISADIEALLKSFELSKHLDKAVWQLSDGQSIKASLLFLRICEPKYIFLGEIFNALDYSSLLVIKEEIKKLINNSVNIFFSSHNLDIVAELSDRVIILKEGEIVFLPKEA
ncbi:MAG: hypothetical protein EOL97_11605 [Spirochaetia bacterium]|nr:hypothetical protein [Spirochaetia bacterium]